MAHRAVIARAFGKRSFVEPSHMRSVAAMRDAQLIGGALIALAACSSDTSLPIEPHCNPLGTGHCMTPCDRRV
jgi:hypothetical protein